MKRPPAPPDVVSGQRTAVRPAVERDLDDLLRLYAQLAGSTVEVERPAAAAALRELLSRQGVTLLMAEKDGAAVGTATLVVVPNLTHGAHPWAQLENMVVDDTVRGAGIGRALIEECTRRAWDAGCYKLQLQSASHRDGAHRFYERVGFSPSSVGFRRYRE